MLSLVTWPIFESTFFALDYASGERWVDFETMKEEVAKLKTLVSDLRRSIPSPVGEFIAQLRFLMYGVFIREGVFFIHN